MRETKNIEFKSNITNTFLKTVSAYANFGDGKIYFGLDDNGNPLGIENPISACLDIENKINDSIDPVPDYNLEISKNGIICLEVKEGLDKPYFYKSRAYKRNDSATIEVDRLELTRLILEGQNMSFEECDSKESNLTFQILREKLKEKIGIEEISLDILKSLELCKINGKYNNAAALIADKNSFPGIDIVRFGETINILLDRETILNKSVLSQYDEALNFYKKYYQYDVINGAYRETVELVPEKAFREGIANAIVHRVWDIDSNINISFFPDYIEIVSPGGLPKGLNKEDFYNGGISILRNKIIGNIFFRLNMIERFGTGIKRINECYKNYELKPSYIVHENSIRMILPVKKEKSNLNIDEQIVYEILKSKELSTSQIMNECKFGKTKTVKILNKLIDDGIVLKTGKARSIKYKLK